MYIAALALMGLMPLIPLNFSKANADESLSLPFNATKNESGVFSKIAGNANDMMVDGCNYIIECKLMFLITLSR